MQNDLIALFIIVLLLGMRHGLDLDHLAAIDAMTRNVSERKRLAKFVGFLFSIGHGSVVIFLSIIVGISMQLLSIPHELDFLMQIASILFLLLFSLISFYSVLYNAASKQNIVMGPKSVLASRLLKNIHHPFAIFCVGGIFAVSFDTVSQVAFLSLNSAAIYGWFASIALGIVFMAGMILIDGMNGYLVSLLVRRADRASLFISRLLGIAIGLFGFMMSISGVMQLLRN